MIQTLTPQMNILPLVLSLSPSSSQLSATFKLLFLELWLNLFTVLSSWFNICLFRVFPRPSSDSYSSWNESMAVFASSSSTWWTSTTKLNGVYYYHERFQMPMYIFTTIFILTVFIWRNIIFPTFFTRPHIGCIIHFSELGRRNAIIFYVSGKFIVTINTT